MPQPSHLQLPSLALCAAAACGGGSPPTPDATSTDWRELVGATWTLAPGAETWLCATRTLDADLYIGAFRPAAPPGTHHTLLTFGAAKEPDAGPAPCDPGDSHEFPIYASGVNTNALELPAGVGVKVAAGQQLHLNLHLFNPGDAALEGHSGVEVRARPAAQLEHEAEVFLPGAHGFEIPQNQEYSYASTCRIRAEQHVFALFPHMHQLGRHLKTELMIAGERRMLWDEPYRFDDQVFTSFPAVTLRPGDEITTTCTWFYPTTPGGPPTVRWGDSSREEMCFSILMRYPRLLTERDSPSCTDEEL